MPYGFPAVGHRRAGTDHRWHPLAGVLCAVMFMQCIVSSGLAG